LPLTGATNILAAADPATEKAREQVTRYEGRLHSSVKLTNGLAHPGVSLSSPLDPRMRSVPQLVRHDPQLGGVDRDPLRRVGDPAGAGAELCSALATA